MKGHLLIAAAVVLACVAMDHAQTPPVAAKPPTLSEVQKLRLVTAAKDVEVWQLRRQVVDQGLQKAQAALQELIAASTPAGYKLTDGLDLVALPPVPAPSAAKAAP